MWGNGRNLKRAPPLDKIQWVLNSTKSLKATVLGSLLGLYNLSSHSSHYGVRSGVFLVPYSHSAALHFPLWKRTFHTPIDNGHYIRSFRVQSGLRYNHYCILTSWRLAQDKESTVWEEWFMSRSNIFLTKMLHTHINVTNRNETNGTNSYKCCVSSQCIKGCSSYTVERMLSSYLMSVWTSTPQTHNHAHTLVLLSL